MLSGAKKSAERKKKLPKRNCELGPGTNKCPLVHYFCPFLGGGGILEIFTFRSIVRSKVLNGSTKSVLKVLNEPTPGKPISKTAVFFQCLAD